MVLTALATELIVWADFRIRLLMDSTAGTEPAAASEQPARSPAKARKYNFGKPGGPRKSRRSSLEHKTGSITKPGKFGGGERQAEPPPEIRYEPLPLLIEQLVEVLQHGSGAFLQLGLRTPFEVTMKRITLKLRCRSS